ncbi:hypothetical protein ACN38_g3894 [Penicillium nordicum]|uniref:Uncharacterized protein n=1 Tax=Penicillium nordicum TaxID=229535 RepID=A0A0M9WHK2_9EURO|nr:hypothetical protein ACN38_g3894 [Penicillium nordicum]
MAGSRLSYGPSECGVSVPRGHSARIGVFISCPFNFSIKSVFHVLHGPIDEIQSAENRVPILGRLGIYFTPTLVISRPSVFLNLVLLCSDNMFASLGIYVD